MMLALSCSALGTRQRLWIAFFVAGAGAMVRTGMALTRCCRVSGEEHRGPTDGWPPRPCSEPSARSTGQCDPLEEQGPSWQGPTGQCSRQTGGVYFSGSAARGVGTAVMLAHMPHLQRTCHTTSSDRWPRASSSSQMQQNGRNRVRVTVLIS